MNFDYENRALIGDDDISKEREKLNEYREYLFEISKNISYEVDESSINLPFDSNLKKRLLQLQKEKCTKELKYIIVIGIGGSNLGSKAIYDALFVRNEPNYPKIFFLDTNDSEEIHALINFLKLNLKEVSEILINIISKSGTTTETIANSEIIIASLKDSFGKKINERIVSITNENSQLWKSSKELGISTLSIPEIIGGRFSIFSSVGLFPLLCAGIDIEQLRKGAQNIQKMCIAENIENNPAILGAIILFLQYQRGKTIHNSFIFHPELESLGKWYRQLLGESTGKEKDKNGNIINVGITPTVSIGSTDLHSVGQLYLAGPKNKFTTFISVENIKNVIKLPKNEKRVFKYIAQHIGGKSFAEISNAILNGIKTTYKKHELPFVEIKLEDISPYSLGEFMQYKMMETMYLGELMNINVFNQPHVETYKEETKKILNN